jgi:hypothetical protein
MRGYRASLQIGLLLAVAAPFVAACSSGVDDIFAQPGKFAYYNCDDLLKRGREAVTRERELKGLMDKASTGAGGELVNALAYSNEYRSVRNDLKQIETVATEKRCEKQFRSISDRSMW